MLICALLFSICDLKAAKMNMQCNLIRELGFYKFKLGHNTIEAIKNIYCIKGEHIVDHSTLNRWFKKFYLSFRNLDDQARLGRLKTVHSKAVLQAIEVNLASSTWRVSGELGLSLSSVVCYLHNLSKSIQSCKIVPYVTKILENFWLTWINWNNSHHWNEFWTTSRSSKILCI